MNQNEIITKALNTKKINKSKAFENLMQISKEIPQEVLENEAFLEVLNFFMPNLSKTKPKSLEQWVSTATGEKDIREYINYVYSTGYELISTNGHRIHVMDLEKANLKEKFPEGFYNKETLTLNEEAAKGYKYPDTSSLFSNDVYLKCVIKKVEIGALKVAKKYLPKETVRVQLLSKDNEEIDLLINKVYWDACVSAFDKDTEIRFLPSRKTIQFNSEKETHKAIIAPLSLDEEVHYTFGDITENCHLV